MLLKTNKQTNKSIFLGFLPVLLNVNLCGGGGDAPNLYFNEPKVYFRTRRSHSATDCSVGPGKSRLLGASATSSVKW